MRLLILGGFLGSGKTTILLQLARYIIDHTESDSETKVMIIENEVGDVGVDDGYLRGGGLQVENLFAGCACCSLSGELADMVVKIREAYNPAWLIIEPTGIATPDNIQMVLKTALNLNSRILVLADAQRWMRLRVPLENLIYSQIQNADVVFINKCDLADEETICKVEADIAQIEPNAKIFRVSAITGLPADVCREALNLT